MPITHNKNRIVLLYLLNNCIPARTAPHILYLNDEYTIAFSKFFIIGLCNSSARCAAGCYFDIISLSTAPSVVFTTTEFLSRNL